MLRAARAGDAAERRGGGLAARCRSCSRRRGSATGMRGARRSKLRRELLDLFLKSAGDFLDLWFESDPIKAMYGFDGIVGTLSEPLRAGHRLCAAAPRLRRGERQDAASGAMRSAAWARSRRRWRNAVARAASRSGRNAAVREVIVEKGRAVGVVTESGEAVRANNRRLQPQPETALHAAGRSGGAAGGFSAAHLATGARGSGTFRMNVALSELPDFSCLPGKARGRASHVRHHHRPEPRLHGPRLSRREDSTAGRRSRSWRCSSPRRSTTRWRRPGNMSRASSASMSRRSCRRIFPAAARGTITRRRSPT